MGSVDRADDRRFRINDFAEDGEAKLGESITNKLKEFMGNYTDDNLVKYVIVLLKNGRNKEEARKELDVFLGDDSDSFVTWLWDHLDSNLGLYVHPQRTHADEAAKIKPTVGDHARGDDSRLLDSESVKGKPAMLSRNRHKREWKSLLSEVAEQPPLRSSEVENIYSKERTDHKVIRGRRSASPPPPPPEQKKRSRHDERPHKKREAVPQAIDAPRRLLQFAVRDAVGTLRPSGSGREPSSKRLRSVVSTSTAEASVIERPRRLQSIARVPNPMATVVKAVQEAAEDVMKVKPSGSVFDRLGRGVDALETDERATDFRDTVVEDEEFDVFDPIPEETRVPFLKTDYDGHAGYRGMIEHETRVTSDFSDDEDYDDFTVMGHRVMDVPQTDTSGGNKGEDLVMLDYGVSRNQGQRISAANATRKIANVSTNDNSWKLPHHLQSREGAVMETRKSMLVEEADTGKSGMRQMKENSNPVSIGNGNATPTDIQSKSQKSQPPTPGSYTAGRPLEDAESRTIFVSNVHFGATLDSLSRHFNKFGEVLKVVIVTDPATGQPIGSAYVEFMRKDAADNALSLDGTSFMSRILKVVKKSSSHQEASPVMTWPRVARGSPYTVPRFSRGPFSRSIGGGFRSRPPLMQGARSLQWKRDAQATMAEGGAASSGKSVVSPIARSLTYVRTETKPDGNPGTT